MDDEIKKPSFLVYYDNEVIVLRLSDEEAGMLFKSLFPYGREEVKPDFEESPALAMAFDILSMAIDRDKERYVKRCETNRENGRKGGLAKAMSSKQSLPNGKRGLANLADKDKDRDMHMEMDNDMEKGNKDIICPELDKPAPDLSGILLPLIDKSLYDVPLDKIALWKEAYPAVDVEQELKKMTAWLEANPKRKKTRRGIGTFINTWLSREQDKGGRYRNNGRQQAQGLSPEDYDLSPEYKAMYKEFIGEDYVPGPDDPFQ